MTEQTTSSSPIWVAHYPDAIKWDADIPVYPVHDMLEQTVRDYGHRPAFDFLGKKWKWAEIGDLVQRFAEGLQTMGLKKGQKVGLFLPNCPYFLIAYYGILKAGGTVVNYNPLYARRELEHQIEDSETDFMVTADLCLMTDKMDAMLDKTRLRKVILCSFTDILPFPKNILFRLFRGGELQKGPVRKEYMPFRDLLKNKGQPKAVEIDPLTDVAVIQYTGGTTGTPKGAMLSHANVTANVEQSSMWFYKTERGQEKMLGVLPFFHVFAMTTVMNKSVRSGLEIIALPRFDLDQTLKLIDKKKPHYFPAVPAIYSAINNHPKLSNYDLTSLRYCISGGAPLPVEVKKEFEDTTGCTVVEGYGLSESSPVVCANPIEGENKAGSIGMPLPGTMVEIVDREDHETPKPRGERGELCVRGPQVMLAYKNRPKETEETLRDGGWLHTGDVAYIDEDGYVFIVDRIKDLIITNGYNVYPRQVEDAIYLHTDVEECIVAGLPDKARGEIVKAWIKLKDGKSMTASDMKAFLADNLSKIEIPRQIEFRTEALPKTMIGKLSRKDIVEEELGKKSGD